MLKKYIIIALGALVINSQASGMGSWVRKFLAPSAVAAASVSGVKSALCGDESAGRIRTTTDKDFLNTYDLLDATRGPLWLLVGSKTVDDKSSNWQERIAVIGRVVSTYGHRKSGVFDIKSLFKLTNIDGDMIEFNSEHITTTRVGSGVIFSDSVEPKYFSDAFVKCSVTTLINDDSTEKDTLTCSGSIPKAFLEWAAGNPKLLGPVDADKFTEVLE